MNASGSNHGRALELVPALQLLVDGLDEYERRALFRAVLDQEKTIIETRAGSSLQSAISLLDTAAQDLDGSSPLGRDAQFRIREAIRAAVSIYNRHVSKR